MRIVVISDTHTLHEGLELPKGDMLIHAGDFTFDGSIQQVRKFNIWIKDLDYQYKIVIAGNHDWLFYNNKFEQNEFDFTYLQDSSIIIEGIKIYGSPWQPNFCNWAFNLSRGTEIKKKWDLIPLDTDILITHGPPKGYLDECTDGYLAGCDDLLKRVLEVKPLYHIFGHIHEAYNQYKNEYNGTTFINASVLNEHYKLVNPPIVIDLKINEK